MGRTLTSLTADVREYLGNPSTSTLSDADITDRINDSYHEVLTRYRFHEQETSATITTVAGTATYALPAGYWYTTYIRDETNDRRLTQRDLGWILAQDIDTRGQPRFFCRFDGNLRFYPVPAAVYSLTHYYRIFGAELASGSDTTIFNGRAWDEIVVWGAVWRCFMRMQEQDRMIHARNIWRTLVNSMPENTSMGTETSQQIIPPMYGSAIPAEDTGSDA